MTTDYERVKAAAQKRVRNSRSSQGRAMSRVIIDRNPMAAEPSLSRRVGRIKRRLDVTTKVATAIATGVDPRTIETLTAAEVNLALALQGRTVDFQDLLFVEQARAAAHAVGRLKVGKEAIGTCFMISRDLLITNNHVIKDEKRAKECRVEFNYERLHRKTSRDVTIFEFDPEKFFVTDERDHMDFTVIALGDRVDGTLTPEALGACPISPAKDKHSIGDFVNVVQHPEGDFKKVVMRENLLIHRGNHILLYTADTGNRSSGSPVFNDRWQVVALHHVGGISDFVELENGVELPTTVNEGVRASRIARELFKRRGTLPPEQQALLDAAISADEFDDDED